MKNRLTIIAVLLLGLLGACKKDGDGTSGGGKAISDDTGAKALFSKMNSLWSGTLRPALSKTTQKYSGTVINGSSGTATVEGQYSATHASSSFSSTTTSTIDVTITFKDYVASDMHINGTVRFFDYSNYRSACSDSGCASSSHTSLDYESADGSGNSLGAANVKFDYAGQSYKDAVTMDLRKSDNAHWSIKVTNSAGQTITTSY
jgi:hypothetical protein